MSAGWTMLNVFSELISFLGLGAYIAGLVVCIVNRRLSRSMILCIVGFAGHIGLYVLDHLVGALGGLGSMGQEMFMAFVFFQRFVGLLGPVSTALLVFGLFRVFTEMRDRQRTRRIDKGPRRRLDEDEDDDEERPAPQPRRPGDRGVER